VREPLRTEYFSLEACRSFCYNTQFKTFQYKSRVSAAQQHPLNENPHQKMPFVAFTIH